MNLSCGELLFDEMILNCIAMNSIAMKCRKELPNQNFLILRLILRRSRALGIFRVHSLKPESTFQKNWTFGKFWPGTPFTASRNSLIGKAFFPRYCTFNSASQAIGISSGINVLKIPRWRRSKWTLSSSYLILKHFLKPFSLPISLFQYNWMSI